MSNIYDTMRQNKNNFSYWAPKIGDCVSQLIFPESLCIPAPDEICDCFWGWDSPKSDTFQEETYAWVKQVVMPKLNQFGHQFLFLKNGTFSNKFNFQDCRVMADPLEITKSLLSINYAAICLGAGGLTEAVFREWIPGDDRMEKRIYNGMPLRPEIRVFYDFDQRQVLYSVNYWDENYCAKAINRDATDALVYFTMSDRLEHFFRNHKDYIEAMVASDMANVQLTGRWSVDIMYNQHSDKYYLIDMATAETSAYWNPHKINERTQLWSAV